MPHFIRVRDKSTRHEFDIDARSFDEELHARVNATRRYPDLDGPGARPRPAKHYTDKAGQPATTNEEISR